ncbi:hypothetical protein N7466_009181 [Penicillium verhagenii]|uniref:uncharacterized protein n=1 Tax=Penicillium verhagenii TaxID=1562060 RepID=UPI00254568B8|nr:uncharacterized protein N7466_009181 [Penicillium verhagenii]KAJ5920855.1 hypothetical protein N7466_009181 [Penicillium verhagenii]
MNWTIPILVFLTTNLWGLYGGIPYTTVQPSRSILDRTIGSFQVASTVFTLGQTTEHMRNQTAESRGNAQPPPSIVQPHPSPTVRFDRLPVNGTRTSTGNQIDLFIHWLRHISSKQTSTPNLPVPDDTPVSFPDRASGPTKESDFFAFALIFFGIVVLQTVALAEITRPQQDLQLEIRDLIVESRQEFRDFLASSFPGILNAILSVPFEVQQCARDELQNIHRSIQSLEELPQDFTQLSFDLRERIQAQFSELCGSLEKSLQSGFDQITSDMNKFEAEYRQSRAQEKMSLRSRDNTPDTGDSSDQDKFCREIWTEMKDDFKRTVEGLNTNLFMLNVVIDAFHDQFQRIPSMMATELTKAFKAEIKKYDIDINIENKNGDLGAAATAGGFASLPLGPRTDGTEADGQEDLIMLGHRLEEVEMGQEGAAQLDCTPQGSPSIGPDIQDSELAM